MITFKKKELKQFSKSKSKPKFNISKILFNTQDKNWRSRLATTSLEFVIQGFDNNNHSLKLHKESLSLSNFVTPKTKTPIIFVNADIVFINSEENIAPDFKCIKWENSFEIKGLNLLINENLKIELTEF